MCINAPDGWSRRSQRSPCTEMVAAQPGHAHAARNPCAWLREWLSRAALWAKFDKRSEKWEAALPPPWVVDTLLARTDFPGTGLRGAGVYPDLSP